MEDLDKNGFWRVSNILNYVTVLPRGLQYSQCGFKGDKIEISNFNTSLIVSCSRLQFNVAGNGKAHQLRVAQVKFCS